MAFFWQVFFRDRKGSSAVFAWGPTADFADGHRNPDILRRRVGVEGHVKAVKNDQQFSFPGFETSQRRIEVVVNAAERQCAAQQRA